KRPNHITNRKARHFGGFFLRIRRYLRRVAAECRELGNAACNSLYNLVVWFWAAPFAVFMHAKGARRSRWTERTEKNMKLAAALLLIATTTLAACASDPAPAPMPEPIAPEMTYDKMGNPVS
ncbi:hypothetical protein O2N63_10455, partial [Aliiroseovarius sp. KMU-50]